MGAHAFFVRIAILRNDSLDALGTRHRQAKTGRSTIVENVQGVAREPECISESQNSLSQFVEGVAVLALLGYLGESESWKIGRDDAIAIRQARN